MMGVPTDEIFKGIIPRSFNHVVALMAESKNKNFLLRCSFIEIYNENIHDLLSADTTVNMSLKEDPKKGRGVYFLNLLFRALHQRSESTCS